MHRDQSRPIQLWHMQIAQDQVKRPLRTLGQCQAPIGGHRYRMAATRQDMDQDAGDVGFISDDRNRSGACRAGRQDPVPGGIWKGAAPRHDSQFYREDGPLSGMALDAQRAPVPLNDAAAERASGECLCRAAASPWRHWHEHALPSAVSDIVPADALPRQWAR